MSMKELLEKRYAKLLSQDFAGVDLCFNLQLDNLYSFAQKMHQELAYASLVDIVASEIDQSHEHFELTYLFLSLEHQLLVAVQTIVEKKDIIPSLRHLWETAEMREREIIDLYGIQFDFVIERRVFCHHLMGVHPMTDRVPNFPYLSMSDIDLFPEMSVSLSPEKTLINIGPVHPLTQSGMRFLASIDNLRIEKMEVEVGYQHQGVEKAASSMTRERIAHVGSLMNLSFADTLNCALAMAVEQGMGIEVSARTKVIRTFVLELERIAEHLDSFIRLGMTHRSHPLSALVLDTREFVADLHLRLIGKRHNGGAIRLGGAVDIFKKMTLQELFSAVEYLSKQLDHLQKIFCSKKSWRDILLGGVIDRNFVLNKTFVGPNMRASGVNWDWRKRRPYYLYADLSFDIPCGVEGSTYDRYVVRCLEMQQSVSILAQLLESIPSGETLRPLVENKNTAVKYKKNYVRLEGPQGELGVFVFFDSEGNISRCKISPSTFSTAFSLVDLAKGLSIDEFSSLYLSLELNSVELDR